MIVVIYRNKDKVIEKREIKINAFTSVRIRQRRQDNNNKEIQR